MKEESRQVLEALIDSATLADVIYLLSGVAGDKADHIAENWQDEALAKDWRAISLGLCSLAHRAEKRRV